MATYAAYRHVELDNVGYGKKRVLKPPGGGSSDIFGAGSETNSPRRVKQHQQSQLGATFFNGGGGDNQSQNQQPASQPASNGSSAPETPRSKPGNDSYKRLFGPPDAPPPSTPNSKYHMRSNISLSSDSSDSTSSPTRSHRSQIGNGDLADGGTNGYHHNDVVAFRRIKRFRGSSCMPRNPVTGDGVDVKPHASRRIVRRTKDGNPVTGAGYEAPISAANGSASGGASSAGSDKSSTDSSPSAASGVLRMKNRVPPGGYSSGLW